MFPFVVAAGIPVAEATKLFVAGVAAGTSAASVAARKKK